MRAFWEICIFVFAHYKIRPSDDVEIAIYNCDLFHSAVMMIYCLYFWSFKYWFDKMKISNSNNKALRLENFNILWSWKPPCLCQAYPQPCLSSMTWSVLSQEVLRSSITFLRRWSRIFVEGALEYEGRNQADGSNFNASNSHTIVNVKRQIFS